MSASQQKKVRQELRDKGLEKRQIAQQKIEKAEKKHTTTKSVVRIVIVVAIIVAVFISSNLSYSIFPAVKIGDVSYSAAQYTFFYKNTINSFVNQYSSYLSQIGLDTSKPYDQQKYTGDETKTWADHFKESAEDTMKQVTAYYAAAEKAGFTLSDTDQATLDTNLKSLSTCYTGSEYTTADTYLAANYGKGVTEKLVADLYRKSSIATAFQTKQEASYTYTTDQDRSYYSTNKDDLDNYIYITYTVDGSVKDTSTTDSTSTSATDVASPSTSTSATDVASPSPSPDNTAEKAEALAAAKTKADDIVKAGTTEDKFKAAVTAISTSATTETTTQGKSLNSTYASWLKDSSRVAGDTTVIAGDTAYYVLYYVGRDNNNYYTVNVRHILIKAVASSDGTYSDEAKATAKDKATAVYTQWKDSAKTEDSFASIANASSEDTGSNTKGGLYENVYKGQMVTNFNDWCFAVGRTAGDTGMVFNDSSSYCGYHIIYYVGPGMLYADKIAEDAQRSKDYSDWQTAQLANYTITNGFAAFLIK